MLFAQVLANGLSLSSIYILMALGFTLVFGIMRVVNFAHGELYMLGAYMVFYFYVMRGWNYFLSVMVGALVVVALSVLLERIAYRPFYRKELQGMIAALGVSIALQHLAVLIWGPYQKGVPSPFGSALRLGDVFIAADRLVVLASAVAILAAFYVFLKFSKLGLAIRAAAQDFEAAEVQGMNASRIYVAAFSMAAFLAAAAGGLIAPVYSVSPFMGGSVLLKAFIVVILGGLGSISGAVLGGVLMGLAESVISTAYSNTVFQIVAFVTIMVVLIWRPWGLLGQPEV